MAKFQRLHGLVRTILNECPEARSDDFVLIYNVINEYVTTDLSLESALLHHKELGIPSLESITRARRKVQELSPELKNPAAVKIRRKEEKEFKAYAKNKLNYQ